MSDLPQIDMPAQSRLLNVATLDRQLAWVVILLPFGGTVAALALAFNGLPPTATALSLCLAMYVLTMLGIEGGYHRLFTHRSFKTFKSIEALLAIFGSMAFQGPVIWWSATHRRHHQCSDTEGDPHSPHCSSLNQKPHFWTGFLYSHLGWLFWQESTRPARWAHYVKDLYGQDHLFSIHMNYFLWLILGFLIPTALGTWIDGGWQGALLGFLWGGLVRTFLVHHFIWSLNSICHLIGQRPFKDRTDYSRNVIWLALPTFGQGWHNNHHAFPASAKVGLKWWQLDMTWLLIKSLAALGLVWDIRTPSATEVSARMNRK